MYTYICTYIRTYVPLLVMCVHHLIKLYYVRMYVCSTPATVILFIYYNAHNHTMFVCTYVHLHTCVCYSLLYTVSLIMVVYSCAVCVPPLSVCVQPAYCFDILDNLTCDDLQVLMETEDEVCCSLA